MPGKELTLLILAGGLSSRYGSSKQEEAVGPDGQLLVEYDLFDAMRSGIERVIIVVRDGTPELLKKRLTFFESRLDIQYAFQSACYPSDREKPWGTGHAVISAARLISGPFLVINADDLYGADMFRQAVNYKGDVSASKGFLLAYPLGSTLSEKGPVSRGICTVDENSTLLKIREYREITRHSGQIMAGKEILDEAIPVSLNAWLLPAEVLSGFETSFQEFIHLNKKDPDAEFFLPDAVSREMMQGLSIQVSQCKGFWCGLTHPGDLEWVRQFIHQATISGKYPHKWN